MFFDKFSEDDFMASVAENLQKRYALDDTLKAARKARFNEHLELAAKSLHQAGLRKEAQMVVTLQEMSNDPATDKLSPEKMIDNLKEHGWVFHDPDSCTADDCAQCSDGPQPQLSQDELKRLRSLLNGTKNLETDLIEV